MNPELQQQLLGELSQAGLMWNVSPNRESQGQAMLRWLPVVNLAVANIELGISSDAHWVRVNTQSVTVFNTGKPCVFLLPVLEIEILEVRNQLRRGLEARHLSTEFIKAFPFEDVVCTGLESHSEHWTALALRWAERLPISPRLQAALHILTTEGPTQKLRHVGQKLLAKQRKS